MSIRVRDSGKHQITLPAAVRESLGIKGGDHILVEVRDDHIVLMPEPRYHAGRLRLHREVWNGVEPGEYVDRERDAWQD